MGNTNNNTGNPSGQAGNPDKQPDGQKAESQKTTPDEGKAFDKDTEFVCVADCICGGKRRYAGDTVTGRKCPPWFIVKPQEDKDKNTK